MDYFIADEHVNYTKESIIIIKRVGNMLSKMFV
jgi:hypothetical protein